MAELYACAAGSSAVLVRQTDAASAQIILRLGEPEILAGAAYQIDTEDILIVTHRESPVQNLTLAQARALFAGEGDAAVQVWVYASAEDVQRYFDQAVMSGRRVSSFAQLAVNPQQMSDVLNATPQAVGILPRHWKVGAAREVFDAGSVPVLAITPTEPAGTVRALIACLQR